MERTRFEVRFERRAAPEQLGPARTRRRRVLCVAKPRRGLRPLARIVSGGELSRLMLALKTLTAQTGRGATLIFDEVDAGIGGHTADVVGRRLQALARDYQVLCITHLPQIAAHGDAHFQITKPCAAAGPTTSVDAPRRRRAASRRSPA